MRKFTLRMGQNILRFIEEKSHTVKDVKLKLNPPGHVSSIQAFLRKSKEAACAKLTSAPPLTKIDMEMRTK